MTDKFIAGVTAIPASGAVLDDAELNAMHAQIDKRWLTAGPKNKEFERQLAAKWGTKHAITCNSGSSANLLAVAAMVESGVWKAGDEIITAATSFPTTVNPLLLYGLVPVFVDCDIGTYNVTHDGVGNALSERTAGAMIAHTMGHPFPISIFGYSIADNSRRRHKIIPIIEDGCDAAMSGWMVDYDRKFVGSGTIGALSTCSFFPAHHITTGEGGAVFTNNPELARLVDSVCSWGRDCFCDPGQENSCGRRFEFKADGIPTDHKYLYSSLGFNLKMTEIQAVCGLGQLKKVDSFVERRNYNWQYFRGAMIHAGLEEHLILPVIAEGASPSWFGFVMTIREPGQRAELQEYLATYKIGSRLLFGGNITRQPYMRGRNFRISGSLANADKVMEDCLWVGVWPGLTTEMLDFVVQKISDFFN